MNGEPPAELTPQQIRFLVELRGIPIADDDLLTLPPLAAALRHQANGLRAALEDAGSGHKATKDRA
jgi:hypothetical protein